MVSSSDTLDAAAALTARLERTGSRIEVNPPRHEPEAPATLDSAELFGQHPSARQEVRIRHGDQTYRLRRTAAGKLILTK